MMRKLTGNLNKNGVRADINVSELLCAGGNESPNLYGWLKEISCKSEPSHYCVSLQNIAQFSHAK